MPPARALGFDIDYKRLLNYFQEQCRLVRAFYYTALIEDQEYSPLRPLVDWLDYNGFTMVTKPTKEFTDAMGRRKIKGNMDIELAIDVLDMSAHLDHVVLFSGDGDFRRLVEAVQRAACGSRWSRTRALAAADGGGRAAAPGGRFRGAGRADAADRAPAWRKQHGSGAAGATPIAGQADEERRPRIAALETVAQAAGVSSPTRTARSARGSRISAGQQEGPAGLFQRRCPLRAATRGC